MGNPLSVYSTTDDLLYAYQHANRYRSPWVYNPSGAFLSEPDLWEVIRNDADCLSSIQRRNAAIVRPWRIIPAQFGTSPQIDRSTSDASKRLASICAEAISNVSRFDAARHKLTDAYSVGRRYARIVWMEVFCSLDGSKEMVWQIPIELKDIDRRRFHWVPEWSDSAPPRKTGIRLEMFDSNDWTWKPVSQDERRSLIEYIWDNTEDRLGHGRGALEAGFFAHYFKTGVIKKLMEGIDRYANGMLIGKIDSLRAASTDLSSDQLTTKTKTFLQNIRSDHVGVLESTDEIQVIDAPANGMGIAMEVVRYFTQAFDRLYNGSVRAAGHSVDGSGAKAAAETEADTSEAFYQFPREDLDQVLDRDLLGAFLYFNQPNIQELGLSIAKRPRFVSAQIKKQDARTRLDLFNTSRVPILKTEYYEALEATQPGPEDDVVEPQSTQSTFGNIGGTFPMGDGIEMKKEKELGSDGDQESEREGAE